MHSEVLKELADEVTEPLSIIFEKSWQSSEIPAGWNNGKITPIFKKGGKEDQGKYRLLSLSSVTVQFNIFVGGTGSGKFGKFANTTKLCVAVDILERRDTVQRDLDRLERWAPVNFMKFNRTKCKILNVGWGNPKCKYRLGREWIENSPEEMDLGALVYERFKVTQQNAVIPQKVTISWAISKAV
ncbi:rna-directed dna polymerase from mobile element jockey-like [Pitangus sulphuratus]|nr:rna-directed dna polymerase from mobile element jockey-like [Pitangus sulphuratus]